MLAACPISDALIISAAEESLCGNAAVYAVIIVIVIITFAKGFMESI